MGRKICICCLLLAVLLGGCGLGGETAYVVVTPHAENADISPDDHVITVSSYLSLKNAIFSFVEEGRREGFIRAESYQGALQEDLSQAVEEIAESPLGAFAVDRMTYDYSRIVGYYEIHVNTTFRRSLEEIRAVGYVPDTQALLEQLETALMEYAPVLLLQVGEYVPVELQAAVDSLAEAHPEFALESPSVTAESYPESGSRRILEINFSYVDSAEYLLECRETMEQRLEELAQLYGGGNSEFVTARRLFRYLGREAVVMAAADENLPLTDSAYGALVERCATGYGFAQGYRLLLEGCGIDCRVVSGLRNSAVHSWCLVTLDGENYYIDPSAAVEDGDFVMGDAELMDGGYFFWNSGELPQVELPDYLKPAEPQEET